MQMILFVRNEVMILMFGMINKINKKTIVNKIGKEFSNEISRISKLVSKRSQKEEETRRWCVDLLKSAMGYSDNEIDTELSVLGKRVDIALHKNDEVFMVIECKAANVNITNAAVNQASVYAMALGAEWAVVTNGHNWKLYRVTATKGVEPDLLELFDIYLLDDDGVSNEDSNYLYFLTKQAINSGETRKFFHEENAYTIDKIANSIIKDDVLILIKESLEKDYKSAFGVSVSIPKDKLRDVLEAYFFDV